MKTIDEIKILVKSKKGLCLSKAYVNNTSKLEFQCDKGHIFKSTYTKVSHGNWCPFCAKCARLTIKEMEELANKRDGKFLSLKYVNNRTKLVWQCKKGHIWRATPCNIKYNHWCPYCNDSKFETRCRDILEKFTHHPFPKSRPKWLYYKRGCLELDGYCKELGVAFEYNGIQHYKEQDFFHRNINIKEKLNFEETQRRDNFKKERCIDENVLLLEIPYTIKEAELEDYIKGKLDKIGGNTK